MATSIKVSGSYLPMCYSINKSSPFSHTGSKDTSQEKPDVSAETGPQSASMWLGRHLPTYIPGACGTCLHILGQQWQEDAEGGAMLDGEWDQKGLVNWGRGHWQRQQRGWVLATRLQHNKKEGCTFTAALDLSAPVEGIIDEVRQAPVQVHGCQTALEAIPGGHELWEVAVHALGQTCHVEVTWRGKEVVKAHE